MKDTRTEQPRVVAVVNDLMFGSRIRAAGLSTGVDIVFVRSEDRLVEEVPGAAIVLLDLATSWLDAPRVIGRLKAGPGTSAVPVVAFGPHVDGDRLVAAREAGADRVLARSAFVGALPDLLASL